MSKKQIFAALAVLPLVLTGCGGGGGGGGGSSSGSQSAPASSSTQTQAAFANGVAGYWQVDTIALNNQLEADADVTEQFTTQRVNASTVKYKDGGIAYVVFNSGDGNLSPPILTYGRSFLISRLVDPTGNYQDESDTRAWKSEDTKNARSGWLANASDALLSGQWQREFTVKSGPGVGKSFRVKVNVVRDMAASSEGALSQMGYVDNKAKVTICLQNDVTSDERALLSRYFNLVNPTENYLQESNNAALSKNSGAFQGTQSNTYRVDPGSAKYRMLVNGKDTAADLAILAQSNGAILDTVDSVNSTYKVMPGLIANGGLIVVKYPNRLLAVLYPAGYRVVENTADFTRADITKLGAGKLGNQLTQGGNGVWSDTRPGVDDFKYVPYAFVPNFFAGSYDNAYQFADLGFNNRGDGYRNVSVYMDGKFTESSHAQWVKASTGAADATLSKWSAVSAYAAFGWNPYRIRNALKTAGAADAGRISGDSLGYSSNWLSDVDYYTAPKDIAAAHWSWIGASLPSSADVGIELTRYQSGYDPRVVIAGWNSSVPNNAGYYQIGKVTTDSGLNTGSSVQAFSLNSWSFAATNSANSAGYYAASQDKFTVDWAGASLLSDAQASTQANWNKLRQAKASMIVGVSSVEGAASNAQAVVNGSIQYLDHIAIYDSVPNVNRSDLGAVKITNLNDIYASPSLPSK